MNALQRTLFGVAFAAALLAPAADAATCANCGTVQSVRRVEHKGEATGLGAVAGGVAGGLLGHQFGRGRGNTVATIAGAGAGAYAGHEIERNMKKKSSWSVVVRMDNGRTRTVQYGSSPGVHEGERVRVVNGGRRLARL